jgi:hypothetical protein
MLWIVKNSNWKEVAVVMKPSSFFFDTCILYLRKPFKIMKFWMVLDSCSKWDSAFSVMPIKETQHPEKKIIKVYRLYFRWRYHFFINFKITLVLIVLFNGQVARTSCASIHASVQLNGQRHKHISWNIFRVY